MSLSKRKLKQSTGLLSLLLNRVLIVTIESDSKISVDALISPGSSDTWRISVLSQDTLKLATLIPNCRFSWIPREANVAAHTLASWSLCNRLANSFGLGSAPQSFCNVILLEQANIL